MHVRKRARSLPQPCLTAELIDDIAAADSVNGLPVEAADPTGPPWWRDHLPIHLLTFLIGSLNLLLINLANSPRHLWCWPWVVAWAGALGLHGGIMALVSRRYRLGDFGRLFT